MQIGNLVSTSVRHRTVLQTALAQSTVSFCPSYVISQTVAAERELVPESGLNQGRHHDPNVPSRGVLPREGLGDGGDIGHVGC